MKKRILSGILTVCMLLSLLPMAASAANTTGGRQSALSFHVGTNSIITKNGDLYVYGDMTSEDKPEVFLKNVKKADTSYLEVAAIKENGDLYVWGHFFSSTYYLVGGSDNTIDGVKVLSHVVDVCLGDEHGGAVTEDGSLYMWGGNYYGQVGTGTTKDQYKPIKVLSDVVSVRLSDDSSTDGDHSAAITKDGSLYMWGYNCSGQVGNGSTQNQLKPFKVLSDVAYVDLRENYSAAITKSGDLYMWGDNSCGQIGNGSTQDQLKPTKILSNVAYVDLGDYHSTAITKNGDLYMWGNNSCGQIGNGTTQNQLKPTKILSNVAYVDLGDFHSAAITKNGDLYMWGDNYLGQIGNGTRKSQLVPLKIMSDVVDVCCDNLVGAVKANGDLYTWGDASEFQMDECLTLKPKKTLSNVRLPSGSNDDEINDNSEYYVQIYATDEDLVIAPGESLDVICTLFKDGKPVANWKKPSFSIDSNNVVSMSDYNIESSGYSFSISGIKEGTASLTVTDSNSGATASINIAVSKQNPFSYRMEDVPSFFPQAIGDKKTQTNFYNVNNLYVNNYTFPKKNGTKYTVSFDVYNMSHMYGSVDVYDSNGRWIESQRIDRYEEIDGLVDAFSSGYFLAFDSIAGKGLSYTSSTYSAKTSVTVSVPEGGYFTISNNFAESPGVFLYNSVYFMMQGARALIDAAAGVAEIEYASDQIVSAVIEKPDFQEIFMEKFNDIALSVSETALVAGYGNAAGSITTTVEEILKSIGIDWKLFFKNAAGIGESAFEVLAGPAGATMKILFTGNSIADYFYHFGSMVQSIDAPYITIHAPSASQSCTIKGVTVTPSKGSIDPTAVPQVFRISNSDAVIITPDGLYTGNSEIYNISFVKNSKEIQPTGKVTVRLPIPSYFVEDECTVFRQTDSGSWEIIDAKLDGNCVVFETTHFSLYAVVNKNFDSTLSSKLPFIDANDIIHATAVGKCVELNIISGYPDGSYKPTGNITRAQMCKMICTALNSGKDPVTSIKATSSFTDIDDHWAEGYIEYCYAKGIVSGIGNGKFNPNGNVTGTQAAKMLLVSLGYNAKTQNYIGSNWSANVNAQASKDGLYNMLSNINTEHALSRDNAAQMIWNTLQANVVDNNGSSKGYTLLQKSYGISP